MKTSGDGSIEVLEDASESHDMLAVTDSMKEVTLDKEEEKKDDGGEEKEDRHPEKRMKAAHKKFEEERLPELRKEYPNFKLSKLKDMMWKEW